MRNLNYSVLSSICALITGILLVVWPDVAVSYLVITIGVLFMLPGLIGLFTYYFTLRRKNEAGIHPVFPIVALGSTILGFWLIIMPEFFIRILMYVLGTLLVLAGISQLMNFISARKYTNVPIIMYVIPLLVLISGLVVLVNPFEAASVPFLLLGVSAIVYSLTDLLRLIIYKRKLSNEQSKIVDITPIEETKDNE